MSDERNSDERNKMNQALQYYLYDEPEGFRLKLSGSLAGDGAQSVYHAWQTALSIIGTRRLVVDVTYVRAADERGRALLRLWHEHGARIIAATAESCALAESVVGQELPQPAAPAARHAFAKGARFINRIASQCGLAATRLSAFFRRLSARATFPADASEPHGGSASAAQKSTEIAGVSGRPGLDCRVP